MNSFTDAYNSSKLIGFYLNQPQRKPKQLGQLRFIYLVFDVGVHHWTSEAGEESRSHVKGKDAGHVLRKTHNLLSYQPFPKSK